MNIVLYLIFFIAVDLCVFLLINKIIKANASFLLILVLSVVVIIFLHSGIFNVANLMPLKYLLAGLEILAGCLVMSLIGRFSINRTLKSTRLTPEVAKISIKIQSFLFFKVLYALSLFVQIMFVLKYYIK